MSTILSESGVRPNGERIQGILNLQIQVPSYRPARKEIEETLLNDPRSSVATYKSRLHDLDVNLRL